MKTFIEHTIPSLVRIDGQGDRLYQTPDGHKYPSVTSVVGLHSQQAIQEWRQAVGAEQADKITKRASLRGTEIHSLCEQYIKTGSASPGMFDVDMFNTIKPHLDLIDNVHAIETPLYSHHLQVAGTVDCIAEYDGKLSIIDFKTSSRVKSRDDIHSYFMQTAAYAVAFEELTRIPVGRLVIIMGVDNNQALIFKEKRDSWIGEFIKLREEYRRCKNL